MFITLLALVLAMFLPTRSDAANYPTVAVIPAKPNYAPTCQHKYGDDYELQAPEVDVYLAGRIAAVKANDEFTALFESYEFKRAANGAPMIRKAGEKSYRFVKRSS